MTREIEINGMTYSTYNAEDDPRGDIGIALADARVRERGFGNSTRVADSHVDTRNVYQRFLEASAGVDSRPFLHTAEKRRLLEEHFPGRFGSEGIQSLGDYSAGKIGSLYRQISRYAHKLRHSS